MRTVELMEQPLRGGLDSYARHNCMIIGASKLPGGKLQLVPAIVKARGYSSLDDTRCPEHIRRKKKK